MAGVALLHRPDLIPAGLGQGPTPPLESALAELLDRAGWPPPGVGPGSRVVIKPNLVTDRDREHPLTDAELAAACTDPAVVEALVRLVWEAQHGRGEIIVADAPLEGSSVDNTLRRLGLGQRLAELAAQGIRVRWHDLRDATLERHLWIDDWHLAGRSWNLGWLRRTACGDPTDEVAIDLAEHSYFEPPFAGIERLRFQTSEAGTLADWHAPGRHVYYLSRTVLSADCLITIPKMKTHRKCGVSLAIKSSVGLARRKYTLPHFRAGWPPLGDEYDGPPSWRQQWAAWSRRFPLGRSHWGVVRAVPRSAAAGNAPPVSGGARAVDGGNWPGNDVVWRMARDLTVALLYGDRQGRLASECQRGYLALVDGLVAGEGQGPLRLTGRRLGLLVAGDQPLDVDRVAAHLMGYAAGELPILHAPQRGPYWLGSALSGPLPAEAQTWGLTPFKRPWLWAQPPQPPVIG